MFGYISAAFYCVVSAIGLRIINSGVTRRAKRGVMHKPDFVLIGLMTNAGIFGLAGVWVSRDDVVNRALFMTGAICMFVAAYLEWRSGRPPRRRRRMREAVKRLTSVRLIPAHNHV